tara:strand:- start:412 stop:546 length:135 start_codon:yes stop_codon:yes gene_type:complete
MLFYEKSFTFLKISQIKHNVIARNKKTLKIKRKYTQQTKGTFWI